MYTISGSMCLQSIFHFLPHSHTIVYLLMPAQWLLGFFLSNGPGFKSLLPKLNSLQNPKINPEASNWDSWQPRNWSFLANPSSRKCYSEQYNTKIGGAELWQLFESVWVRESKGTTINVTPFVYFKIQTPKTPPSVSGHSVYAI